MCTSNPASPHFETDNGKPPIMIESYADDGPSYANLTHVEDRRLASMLNAFLKKGQDE
jgi:hypothetical protein